MRKEITKRVGNISFQIGNSNICKIKVPSWQISNNMEHVIPDANTTQKVYWSDRQPYREDIFNYFDNIIEID